MSSVKVEASKIKSDRNIEIKGFKHALVPIISASLGVSGDVRIDNVPDIEDMRILKDIVEDLGGEALYNQGTFTISADSINKTLINPDLSQKIHGSIYLIPTLLGRMGKVEIGKTGGCQIGSKNSNGERPIHHMISILESFGATFKQIDDRLFGKILSFKACTVDIMDFSEREDLLTGPLVSGATKTAILASLFVHKGKTVIKNPYRKPDVTDLLKFLIHCGWQIKDEGHTITIYHNTDQKTQKRDHFLISDIIEIITYISLSVYMEEPLTLNNITVYEAREALSPEINYLNNMNINLKWGHDTLHIPAQSNIKSVNVDVTSEGIYSDSQPFFTLMLLNGDSESQIRETVWKNRFSYAEELSKLGFHTDVNRDTLRILPSKIYSKKTDTQLYASDLRAAAVLILASLKSPSPIKINNINHLDRGYEDFVTSLKKLGANIY